MAIVALAAAWPDGRAFAQTPPNSAQSKFTAPEVPSYDVESLKTPKTTVPASTGKADLKQPDQPASGTKLPTQVELGKYKLDFKAGRTSDVAPRTGFDSGETSNLSKMTGQKSESAGPDYFGLKLTAPTR